MKATGPTACILYFDTTKTSAWRAEQAKDIAYHIARLLTGEATSEREWEYAGIRIECEPDSDQGDD